MEALKKRPPKAFLKTLSYEYESTESFDQATRNVQLSS